MSENKPGQISPPNGGFFPEMALQLKLIWRLMGDARVNFFLKLIPVASIAYLINPVDLPTPIDDFGVIGLALYLFVELCPEPVVREHRNILRNVVPGEWSDPRDEAIDAEFDEVGPEDGGTS
ncbi:MAG: hypothetical protein HPY76_03685 [Anaerolineae bacterium]|nr:hypothetical protein [Anaerolineae bacterium]